jgi:uncharacterized protein YraI
MRFSDSLKAALIAGFILPMTVAAALAERAWTTSGLNVRAGPGTGHQVIHVLKPGKAVNVRTCKNSGWCFVVYNKGNRRGWVSGRYLDYGGGPVVVRPAPPVIVPVPIPVPRRRVYRPYYGPRYYYGPRRHYRPRSLRWR